jgi:hypothetical protein
VKGFGHKACEAMEAPFTDPRPFGAAALAEDYRIAVNADTLPSAFPRIAVDTKFYRLAL